MVEASREGVNERTHQSRDDRAGWFQALTIVVEGDVSVEGGELEGAICGNGHDLGRVENQTDIVE